MSEKAEGKQGRKVPRSAFKPGQSGNPKGKPKGCLHKATRAALALLDGEAEALTRKCIEKALEGDVTALRLCLERLVPPCRERPLALKLPTMRSAADLPKVSAAIMAAVAAGRITPGEGAALADLLDKHRRALELSELEERLSRLETNMEENRR